MKFCRSLDPCDDAQLQSLVIRFEFLRSVHSCHSAGEDQVILKELEQRLYKETQCASGLHEEHDDEAALFVTLREKVEHILRFPKDNHEERGAGKKELSEMMDEFSEHLFEHMENEEKNILPLVEKYFSVEDQDQLVRRAMAKVGYPSNASLSNTCHSSLVDLDAGWDGREDHRLSLRAIDVWRVWGEENGRWRKGGGEEGRKRVRQRCVCVCRMCPTCRMCERERRRRREARQ